MGTHQSVIDMIAGLDRLDDLIPAVLAVVARTFQATTAIYFDFADDGGVHFRYCSDGRRGGGVDCLPGFAERPAELQAALRGLAAGFLLPDDYLGSPPRQLLRPVVIDHRVGSTVPALDQIALAMGWAVELLCPLVANGLAFGALGVYANDRPAYSPADLALAESIVRHLSLAVQTRRLAEVARRQGSGGELPPQGDSPRADVTIQPMIDAVDKLDQLDDLVPAVLRIVARAVGADDCCVFLADPGPSEVVRLRYWLRGDQLFVGDGIVSLLPGYEHTTRFALDGFVVPDALFGEPNTRRSRPVVLDHVRGTAMPAFDEWTRAYGRPLHLNVPLVVNHTFHGSLSVFREGRAGDEFTAEQVRLAEVVSCQLALAVATHRLADTVRRQAAEAAAAAERQRVTEERLAELTRRDRILSAVTQFTATLGQPGGLSRNGPLALGRVLAVEGVSRACVLRNDLADGERVWRVVWEAVRPGLPAQQDTPGFNLLRHADYPDQVARFEGGESADDAFVLPHPVSTAMRAALGAKAASLVLPVFVRGVWWGLVGFDNCDEDRPWTPAERTLLRGLVAGLEAALAREQAEEEAQEVIRRAAEEQLADLAAANESLRRITDQLGASDELSEFLTAALGEVCRASGAKSAAVFAYELADHTLRKLAFVADGRPRDMEADPDLELWRAAVPAGVTDCWDRMLAGGQPVWTDLDDPPADQWAFAAGWHRRMGHRAMAAFLLRVGGRPVGFLRLCFPTPERPTATRLEQCRTLAQQAALALQMSRTAARARTAAVAVEQERAARERLGELAAANRMLVSSLDGFTINPDPAEFLGKVLTQLTGVLGVPVVELWHARDMSGVVYPGPMCHDGRVLTPEQADHPMRHTGYRVPTSYDLIDAVDRRRHILWSRLADHPDVPERMWRWYREKFGTENMVNLPLVVGRRVLGAAVGFAPADHVLTDSQLELAHALATQLALALQLGELNDRGREMAVLAERTRLARDIHDTLAQGFLGVILHLETARRCLAIDTPRAVLAVDQAQGLAQASLNEARRSVGMLRAKPADQGDLAVALAMLTREAAEQSPFPIRFETTLATCPVPAAVAEQITRIAAEAVHNARRHARPTRVIVSLARETDRVRVTVADNGIGFDPAAVPADRYGLVGMRERAAAVMCGLTIDAAPGRGTTVRVVWPDGEM